MNAQYPDRRSEGQRIKTFLDFKMKDYHSLEEYSAKKANLWTICRESNKTSSEEFFGHWRDGLQPTYREEVLKRLHKLRNFKDAFLRLSICAQARKKRCS